MEFYENKVDDILIFKSVTHTANITNAKEFKNIASARVDNGITKIIVDLRDVPLMDSTFLGAMVIVHRKLSPMGGMLKLCGASESILTLLGLTKLENTFRSYDTIETAINSFV